MSFPFFPPGSVHPRRSKGLTVFCESERFSASPLDEFWGECEPLERGVLAAYVDCLEEGGPDEGEEVTGGSFLVGV